MFQIDRFGRQPIYEQIIQQTEQLVAAGTLHPGDQLPSVRMLSQALSANPNTLQKAYAELERRGITVSVPGSGRFISKEAPRLVSEGMQTLLAEITSLSARLRIAGVPMAAPHAAVDAAYAAGAQSPPASQKPSQAQPSPEPSQTSQDDALNNASRKDAEQ